MTSPIARWTVNFTIAATAGLIATAAQPSAAQGQDDAAVFVDLGRWTIFERPRARYCELRLATDGLVFIKFKGEPGRLRLRTENSGGAPQGEIVWAFDDTRFGGQMYDARTYGPSEDSTAIEREFRQARVLTVSDGERTVARISLKTSSAGFRLLKQCAEQWRGSYAPVARTPVPSVDRRPATRSPVAPPTRTREQPQAAAGSTGPTGPFPPNRALAPIDPARWVRQEDFRRFSRSRFGSGTVRFTLQVDRNGRVDRCIIEASSGSSDFDEATCKALERRARFEPASDANGNARPARYSSSVRFAVE